MEYSEEKKVAYLWYVVRVVVKRQAQLLQVPANSNAFPWIDEFRAQTDRASHVLQ